MKESYSKGLHILLTLKTESEDLLLNSELFLQYISRILAENETEIVGIAKHIFENGKVYIDDYAHHPTELNAVIGSIRAFNPDKKLLVVFQPH